MVELSILFLMSQSLQDQGTVKIYQWTMPDGFNVSIPSRSGYRQNKEGETPEEFQKSQSLQDQGTVKIAQYLKIDIANCLNPFKIRVPSK